VNVYYLPDPEMLHRQLVTALFVWLGESLDGFQLCDGTNAVETDSESSPSGVYWETGSKITNRNQ
jgi:hypothetical protein